MLMREYDVFEAEAQMLNEADISGTHESQKTQIIRATDMIPSKMKRPLRQMKRIRKHMWDSLQQNILMLKLL